MTPERGCIDDDSRVETETIKFITARQHSGAGISRDPCHTWSSHPFRWIAGEVVEGTGRGEFPAKQKPKKAMITYRVDYCRRR
jgi:hypothetical protein